MIVPYLLDTNTCSYVINKKPGHEAVVARMAELRYGDLLLSSVVLAELQFMIANSGNPPAKSAAVNRFLAYLRRVDFDGDAAAAYGPLRSRLERMGNIIGPLDTLIAAHALSLKATMVTNNTRHFAKVPGLGVENWYPDSRRGK